MAPNDSKYGPLPTLVTGGAVVASGLFFALAYGLVELLRSSVSPFLLGGDANDWLQIGLGIGLYWLMFCGVALPPCLLLRRCVRAPGLRETGTALTLVFSAWVVVNAVRALGMPMRPREEALFAAVLLAFGVVLWLLQRTRLVSPTMFCMAWGIAAASGIATLYHGSRFFFLDANRVVTVGTISVLWAGLTGLLSTGVGIVGRRRRMPDAAQLAAMLALGCLVPLILGSGHSLATCLKEPTGFQVVFITCDALRADYCSVYGGQVPTPNLESLGKEGKVFERCYSLAPWTPPSICGMFSSKFPQSMNPGSRRRQWVNIMGSRADVMAYWLDEDGRSEIDRMRSEGILTAAFIGNPIIASEQWLLRGFEEYTLPNLQGDEQRGLLWRFPALQSCLARFFPDVPEKRPHDTTRVYAQYAVEFIHRHRDREFFLWVHFMDPHDPYDPPKRYRTLAGDWPLYSPADQRFCPISAKMARTGKVTEDERRYIRSLYEGEIRYVDEAIGRIKREVETRTNGHAYLCVSADHGEELWDHGTWGHGQSLYDEHIRVPLLFWGPCIKAGRVTDPVSSADILPTLTRLMGRPVRDTWRWRQPRSLPSRSDGNPRAEIGASRRALAHLKTTPCAPSSQED